MRPANVIAAVVGILSIALGVWALIKTGLNTDHIFTPTTEVLGLPHTPALALGEIGFGILLLFAAATRTFGTVLIALLGVASLAFGVIVVSDSWSGRVERWTAASHDNGWMFILIGVVFILAAVLPLFVSKRTTPEAPPAEPQQVATEPEPLADDVIFGNSQRQVEDTERSADIDLTEHEDESPTPSQTSSADTVEETEVQQGR